MKEIYNNVYLIKIGYFNMYVIKGKDGDILIDTGFRIDKKKLKKQLDKFNIKTIILTHAHIDHTWNTKYIKELYDCKVYIGEEDVKYLDNSKIINKPLNKFLKVWSKMMRLGMKLFKQDYFEVDGVLKDYDFVNFNGVDFIIINLPGHTYGSIGIIYKDVIFAGDSLVNRGKYCNLSYQMQDKKQSIISYKKLLSYKPKYVFIGHDNPIDYKKLKESYKKIIKNES